MSHNDTLFSLAKIDLRFSLVTVATLNPPAVMSLRPMDVQSPTLEVDLRPPDHPPRSTSC